MLKAKQFFDANPCVFLFFLYLWHVNIPFLLNNLQIMASKRTLKHQINYICSELFAECVAASLYNQKKSDDNADAILTSIMVINNDFIKRVSHPEPGMPAKTFYKELILGFNGQVDEIIDQIAALE